MAINIFDKYGITKSVNRIQVVEPFVLSTVFGSTPEFHADGQIAFEIETELNKIAMFVQQHGPAIQIKKGSKELKKFTIPRTFEEMIFTDEELLNYKQLTSLVFGRTPDEITKTANDWVFRKIQVLKNRVMRLKEKIACDAIALGGLTVAQQNIAFTVDFGFTSDNLFTVESANKWDTTTANIEEQLMDMNDFIVENTGNGANLAILGLKAAKALRSNAKVQKSLDTNNNKVGSLDFTAKVGKAGRRIGNINGIELFAYNQKYVNASGVSTDFIPEGKCILLDTTNEGFRNHYAPAARIKKEKGGLELYPVEYFMESKVNEDETALSWKLEQKSLSVIHEPFAVQSVTVV